VNHRSRGREAGCGVRPVFALNTFGRHLFARLKDWFAAPAGDAQKY